VLILFKLLMLATLAAIAYVVLFQIRQRAFHRIVLLVMGATVGTMIAVPDLATVVAQSVGIGRGADFIFYLSHMLAAYLIARLYQRSIRQEEQLTRLVRSLAFSEVRVPERAPPAGDLAQRLPPT
jgi:hypothetical protein